MDDAEISSFGRWQWSNGFNTALTAIGIELKKLPSVQPERKTGKWINHRNDMGHNIADCSKCGEAMQWYDPDTRPNYCPNCGMKMEMEMEI